MVLFPGSKSVKPIAMGDIPGNGFSNACLEQMPGLPAEFVGDFPAIDRVPSIVTGTVLYMCNQRLTAALTDAGHRGIDGPTNCLHHVNISPLTVASNRVRFTDSPLLEYSLNG